MAGARSRLDLLSPLWVSGEGAVGRLLRKQRVICTPGFSLQVFSQPGAGGMIYAQVGGRSWAGNPGAGRCHSEFLMAPPSWAPHGAAAEPEAASREQGCSLRMKGKVAKRAP